jgi:hypothetical protein
VKRGRPVSLALLGLFVWLNGCTYTQIEVTDIGGHGKVRVETADGGATTLHEPWVEADSIKGRDGESIALSDVRELEAVGTSSMVWAFPLGVAVVAGVLLLWDSGHCKYDFVPPATCD